MTYYFYEGYINKSREKVEEYIAENVAYTGEESLMNIQENEVCIIESVEELENWCNENGENIGDYMEVAK